MGWVPPTPPEDRLKKPVYEHYRRLYTRGIERNRELAGFGLAVALAAVVLLIRRFLWK